MKSHLEKACAALNKLLVEMWMFKILLVRTQRKMKSMIEKEAMGSINC